MIGINTPEITLPPLEAISHSAAEAERIAGGLNYHSIGIDRLEWRRANGTLSEWLRGAQALIIGLPDGYAIHAVDPSDGAILAIRARVYVEAL